MWMIIDARMPRQAIGQLTKLGKAHPMLTKDICYESIAGHPDIFFCKTPGGIVAATNAPESLKRMLNRAGCLIEGRTEVGRHYPSTTPYNAFVNNSLIVHRMDCTDKAILQSAKQQQKLDVKQGYARCNLVEAGGLYICSDRGIQKKLNAFGLETFFVDPHQILLPREAHGFVGGCATPHNDLLVVTGSRRHFKEGEALEAALSQRGIKLYELYDGPLWDGGGILTVD